MLNKVFSIRRLRQYERECMRAILTANDPETKSELVKMAQQFARIAAELDATEASAHSEGASERASAFEEVFM